MTEQKIARTIEDNIHWLHSVHYICFESDGILFKGQDIDLQEECWLKLFSGHSLYISYDRYHKRWTFLQNLRLANLPSDDLDH